MSKKLHKSQRSVQGPNAAPQSVQNIDNLSLLMVIDAVILSENNTLIINYLRGLKLDKYPNFVII